MDTFEIQEIAIYIGSVFPQQECEIIDPLGMHTRGLCNAEGQAFYEPHYGVKLSDGRELWTIPSCLRKKKYDGNKVTSWDECIWRPEVVNG